MARGPPAARRASGAVVAAAAPVASVDAAAAVTSDGFGTARFQGRFKPHRVCFKYVNQGWCRHGDTCTFAHTAHELHPTAAAGGVAATPGVLPRQAAAAVAAAAAAAAWHQPGLVAGGIAPGQVGASGSFWSTSTALTPGLVVSSKLNADAPAFAPTAPSSLSADASPFVPGATAPEVAGTDDDQDAAAAAAAADAGDGDSPTSSAGAGAEEAAAGGEAAAETPSPGRSRPKPAPLALVEDERRRSSLSSVGLALASPLAVGRIPSASPTAAAFAAGVSPLAAASAAKVLASPAHVKAAGYPMPLSSPTVSRTGPLPLMVQSPAACMGAPSPMLLPRSPQHGPMSLVAMPAAIPKNVLLQGRMFAQRLEQGPPGLAQCAPTPTSFARKLGFRYPQPGYISALPADTLKMQTRPANAPIRMAAVPSVATVQ
eukprot:TRINITY_DN54558_c0_g1_i1.p1 TRINITY_DN54558_c0_g1~~TRINITY_DN54558_c0_g1_i1.p1  ORF type:complete len:446 (+),score=94.04 TRINITY_DN54558_c0_g1_i1:50-1339(+)